jgi:hypothetical protein
VLGPSTETVYCPGTSNSTSLVAAQNINAASFISTSDYRIKENIEELDYTFIIDGLRPVIYNKKGLNGKKEIGLIAHEVEEIYPYLVDGDKDGEKMQGIHYTGIIPILIKEIKEMKKEIEYLKSMIK